MVTLMERKSLYPSRDTFPPDNVIPLRDLMLDLTAHSVQAGHSKVILRKLFVAVRVVYIEQPVGTHCFPS